MIDPQLERQYADTKDLLALWQTFYDFMQLGVKKEGVTPERESQFLEIKSRIAMLHDSFMSALTTNQNVGQEVLSIITRAITLKHLGKQSAADLRKMEMDWHDSFLLINETVGELETKRSDIAGINEKRYKAEKAGAVVRQKVLTFLTSTGFKLAVGAAVLFGATFGVQWSGIYDYNDLGKIESLKTPYGWGKAVVRKFSPDSPWPSIHSVNRIAFARWPAGFQAPEKGPDSKEDAIAKFPVPAVRSELSKAIEFRHEVTKKQHRADTHIYTYLLPTVADAKAVEDEWTKATPEGPSSPLKVTWEVHRNYNAISVIHGGDRETVNYIRTIVFEMPSI